MKIYPSLAAADPLTIGQAIAQLDNSCDGFHVDVMDFHFVANVSFGPHAIAYIDRTSKHPLFVHLMVDNPEAWLTVLELKKDARVAFHPSTTRSPAACAKSIAAKGWRPVIAILPNESVEIVAPLAAEIDAVIVLCVPPGFSGQEMKSSACQNIAACAQLRTQTHAHFEIVADGGVNEKTVEMVKQAGADGVVVGSGIFAQQDPGLALQKLKKALR